MSLDQFFQDIQPAYLALADGSVFSGRSVGALGETVGEVVFNTAMTGYQEILTDPSYAEQIVTLTYPHVGNVGVNPMDNESERIWASGLIIREMSPIVSNWRAEQSLTDFLQQQNIVAIANIDTRCLTRILREKGAQNGCILTGEVDPQEAVEKAKAYAGLHNKDLAKMVSCKQQTIWDEPTIDLTQQKTKPDKQTYHVVAYDFGVKRQMLRKLVDRGCRITLVPAQTTAEEVMALKPDGVLLSNGPGDPAPCDYALKATQILIANRVPVFGICLGFQLLALACGATRTKMKFGHHGANHPVQDLVTKQVAITSQNHSFAIDEDSLPDNLRATHRSLFDGSLQGISHTEAPAFAFQGHPEASPGPHDMENLFDRFIDLMQQKSFQSFNHSKSICQKEQT